MTLLGWSPVEGMNEIFTLEEAAQHFEFDRVNRAGAKFDWDKLNWINSQYLHHMPVDQLTDLLIPYWQAAGYAFDLANDRAWLEQVTALIATSLVRLQDAAPITRYLFVPNVGFTEPAAHQLQQAGVATALESIISSLEGLDTSLTADSAQSVIQQAVQAANVKKGVVMKSLRAALTGDLQGPELIPSWLLLHQRRLDLPRLRQALAAGKDGNH
jgi:glutamyl-tRNA synthetase